MKIFALSVVFLLIGVRLAFHRQGREQRWTDCYQHPSSQPVVFLALVEGEGGRYRFSPEPNSQLPFLPEVLTVSPLGRPAVMAPQIGRQYRVSGRLFCRPPHRNPSLFPSTNFQDSPSWHFRLASLTEVTSKVTLRASLLNAFFSPLNGFPRLHALAQSTWTGETIFQSPAVIQIFREGGLLAILALSGEHVAIFLIGAEAAAGLFFGALFPLLIVGTPASALRALALGWRRFRLLAGASLLLWTSGGLPSMKRTWWMALFWCCLKCRSMRTNSLQWLASSFAFALAWDPGVALSPGFLLSAWGTFALFHVSENQPGKKTWATAILLSLFVPMLILPWTAHLFSKVAVLGILLGGVGGALWAAVFLPLGFLAPVVAHGLPQAWVFSLATWIERGLGFFERGLEGYLPHVKALSFSTLRPTLGECLAAEVLLITLAVTSVRFLAAKHWFPGQKSR